MTQIFINLFREKKIYTLFTFTLIKTNTYNYLHLQVIFIFSLFLKKIKKYLVPKNTKEKNNLLSKYFLQILQRNNHFQRKNSE